MPLLSAFVVNKTITREQPLTDGLDMNFNATIRQKKEKKGTNGLQRNQIFIYLTYKDFVCCRYSGPNNSGGGDSVQSVVVEVTFILIRLLYSSWNMCRCFYYSDSEVSHRWNDAGSF